MQETQLLDLLTPELETLGVECVKCEIVGSNRHPVVRLYIDKPGGVTVGDCTRVSRAVGVVLERDDPFPGRYLLEVSSPGSNRPLTTPAHFERFTGSPARVQVAGTDGEKTTYTGRIRCCINGSVTLETDDGEVSIALATVIRATLLEQEYKIDKKMKQSRRDRRGRRRQGERS